MWIVFIIKTSKLRTAGKKGQKQALSLLISMLLHLFSHRKDLRCFLSGPGRARRCAVLNSYNFCIFSLLSYCKSTDVKCSYVISPGIIVRDFCFVNCRETILLIPYNFTFILCRNSADLPLPFTGYFLFMLLPKDFPIHPAAFQIP